MRQMFQRDFKLDQKDAPHRGFLVLIVLKNEQWTKKIPSSVIFLPDFHGQKRYPPLYFLVMDERCSEKILSLDQNALHRGFLVLIFSDMNWGPKRYPLYGLRQKLTPLPLRWNLN